MSRNSISSQILNSLAADRRVVVADWRVAVYYMRHSRASGFKVPDPTAIRRQLSKMQSAGEITPIPEVHGVFRVTVPFASAFPCPDEAVVQEASPTAVFGYHTALAYHALIDEIPETLHFIRYGDHSARLPLGTTPDDWTDLPEPPNRRPAAVGDRPVAWTMTKPAWDFGHLIGFAEGTPIYVTDLERTLLDSLRFPESSGGIANVIRAWKRAQDRIALSRLVSYADRLDQAVLRQRAGYLLERMGFRDSAMDRWAAASVRGSSSRLVAQAEFSAVHSERWSLSLNVAESILSVLDGPA